MYIMSGNIKTVEFDAETFDYEILDSSRAPLYIKNRGNVKKWIEDRAIDATRANSRALKSMQGLSKNADAYKTAMKMDAAVITDDFWVKRDGDTRAYEDIVFKRNDFFGLALYRDLGDLSKITSRTPELTNIGSQEKAWTLEEGRWWLYKNQPFEQVVSEYITYRLGELLGFEMAQYCIVEKGRFIKSKDFTDGKYNLQHIDCVMRDHMEYDGEVHREITDDDYGYNYSVLKEMDARFAAEYFNICVLDAICENFDRHTKNYGFLTERSTGKITSLAPNYDNNYSIFANVNLNRERTGGVLAMFLDFVKDWDISLPKLSVKEADIEGLIGETEELVECDLDRDGFLRDFLWNGIKRINFL